MKTLRLVLVLLLSSVAHAAEPPLRLALLGDSTVCDYPAGEPNRGWGLYLEERFQPGTVKVLNFASSGRSTKTFIAEGRWEKARAAKPDVILIQFGHNDSHAKDKPESTDAATDYSDYLRRYVDDARAIGATPIFVTPMHRRTFNPDGTLKDNLRPYADAMKRVAAEKEVPVIDLHASSGELFAQLGEKSNAQFANKPDDATHFNEQGARAMVELVMRELPKAEPRLGKLTRSQVTAQDVALSVTEPSGVTRQGWPVTSGVPFAQGVLPDDRNAALVTLDGQPVPLQTEVLARWPDGSVRWLLLDFQVDLAANQKKHFTLRHGATVSRPTVPDPVRVSTRDRRTTIETGRLRFELNEEGFNPFGAVWADLNGDGKIAGDERITSADRGGLFVRDPNFRRFAADQAPAEIVVEQAGPLRVCVRVTGRHADARGAMFSYVVRLHAFRGQPFVRCDYTFTNDQPDALMTGIKELGVTARLAPEAGRSASAVLDGRTTTGGRVFQVDEKRYDRDGQAAGAHAVGWAAVAGGKGGFALGLREFWQHWPKAIEARDGAVTLGICPDFPAGLYDGKPLEEENKLYYALRGGLHTFKVGLAKTHEVWAAFFAGPADAGKLAQFFQAAEEPLLATCEPAYASATRAAGEFPPAATSTTPDKFFGYDAWFSRALTAHLKRRDEIREYGMLNYGDWFGERVVNWGNLEYDLAYGMFIQYLRTGERRYFERGAQASRHHIDVDVIHATNAHLQNSYGPPPVVGQIWRHSLNHTGGYYTNAPLPVEKSYQMGHSTDFGHVWISGDLNYYYLTGDRRARDVALLAADAMAANMPTRAGTHIRGLGWPMILVLAAYEATGDAKYLEAAASAWRVLKQDLDPQRGWVVKLAVGHCLHPAGGPRCEGNVPFMEGLTLGALARYHRVTGDPDVLKAITVGVDQMIRECWMEDIKAFRYTACTLTFKNTAGFLLSLEGIAYEVQRTGNPEHRRILREGFRAALPTGGNLNSMGKGFGQTTFFSPFALEVLETP
ncbi:MAG: GDSL-type esterase/lipase family protein [Opitutaceae bacterium]|nr:GDSL-type esterase/lipase family protein [Opitutaceae bacterium]